MLSCGKMRHVTKRDMRRLYVRAEALTYIRYLEGGALALPIPGGRPGPVRAEALTYIQYLEGGPAYVRAEALTYIRYLEGGPAYARPEGPASTRYL
jgi:hypothetical protein